MLLVKPSFEILQWPKDPLQLIELAGRTCYKSEDKITDKSAEKFCKMLCGRGHESVIEHVSATVKFVVDRGVSHEMVRHRICSFSQESTRYCNYSKKGMAFVIPPWVDIEPGEYSETAATPTSLSFADQVWFECMCDASLAYSDLLDMGQWNPQQARSVLPNSLKTEVVWTANFREWMHIFKLRNHKAAHPQMVEIMSQVQEEFAKRCPVLFYKVN